MKVGLLIYGAMNDLSGGYLYNRLLVDYLRRMGDEVSIFAIPHASYWQHLTNQLSDKLFAQIRAAKLDVLIQDELAHPSLVFSNQRVARRCKIPLISLVHLFTSFDHHPWYSGWLIRALERRYLRSVQGLILNSRTTHAQARQLLENKLPPYCIAVPAGNHFTMAPPATVHNPSPTAPVLRLNKESLHERMIALGPLRILSVGNLVRRKAAHLLIEALSQINAEDYEVTLVGRMDMEPEYVTELKAAIEKHQLQDRVKMLGALSGTPLINLYQQHHLMALPSAFESYGIVYVEAQQFGLPVIGTRAGAAHEIIQQGENGYLIPPGDAHALAMDLQYLHQHRGTLWTLSQNALAAFAEHPTWDQSNEITRQFLLGFVNQPSA